MSRLLTPLLAAFLVGSVIRADDAKPKPPTADDVTALVAAAKKTEKTARNDFYKAFAPLDRGLHDKGTAEATAKLILDRQADFDLGEVVGKRLAAEKNAPAAAELVLGVAKAKQTVAQFGNKGGVAVGKVVVADGKLEPDLVLAQMSIQPDGLFAAEVGDMAKSLTFRAAGYEDVTVQLAGKAGETVDVGTVTLKPMDPAKAATVKGTVALDNKPAADEVKLRLSLMVPPANTPHNGYSPRRKWPEGTTVTVGKDGAFTAAGLTPGEYYFTVEAKGHTNVSKRVKLDAGKESDQGVLRLRSTDLGFYIGSAAPKTGELTWEKDYAAAIKKAADEKKPVLVMMTATWCGPCKMLEKDTLNDPWVRHFLSGFVLVKAYEDAEVEKKYGLNGYPTLVFTDADGKEAHRTVGYQQPVPFLGQCVKGFDKLKVELPAELKALVAKKVIGE